MFATSRESCLNASLRAIPGLLHFGFEPLRLFPGRDCKRVKVRLQGRGVLNLDSLSFFGPGDPKSACSSVKMSSKHSSSQPAENLLKGGPIHTENELDPWWEAEFSSAVHIAEIKIGNRLGVWCGRSYGLNVDVTDDGGSSWTYDALSSDVLFSRIKLYRDSADAFVSHVYGLAIEPHNAASDGIFHFSRHVRKLIESLSSCLNGDTSQYNKLVDYRLDVLQSVIDILEPLRERDLVSTLRVAYRLIDWLLPRSNAAKPHQRAETELTALGFLLTYRLTERHSVELPVIKDLDRLLLDGTSIRLVEKVVNQAYQATGLTRSHLPILFRAHGMSGSPLLSEPQSFVRSMKEVERALGAIGYESAICYGTFLGAVRDKGFIPHDDDVDMAVTLHGGDGRSVDTELAEIIAKLKVLGIDAGLHKNYKFLKIKAPVNKRLVDVFPIIPVSESVVGMYMQQLAIRDVPRDVVLPFSSAQLYGETFLAPASADGFLTERYGSSWRTPLRTVGSKTLEA